MDWEAEGLLDGLEGEARDARAHLLDRLHEDGVEIAELKRAVAEDRLVLLPVERALLAPPEFTAGDVAEKSGIDMETLAELRRAFGLSLPAPEERAFTQDDVDAAVRTRTFLDAGIPREGALELARVLGEGMSRYAEATRGVFGQAFLRPGDSEADLAIRLAEMSRALLPEMGPAMEHVLRLHLLEQVRHAAIDDAQRQAGRPPEAQEMAVGFADIVGFTRLSQEVEGGAEEVSRRLVSAALEVLAPPTRLVKSIGDAVMLVSPDGEALVETMLALLEHDALPQLRGGASYGPAVSRYGDWYGTTVNLASRLCDRARDGALLIDQALHDELPDAYAISSAGEKGLKGFDRPRRTFRVRRRETASAP